MSVIARTLTERIQAPPRRVDRERCIIKGVKVLSPRSRNQRRYLPEAIREAVHLYENAPVKQDHPQDPDDQRSADDTVGWLRNARVEADGCLYADLHYFRSHPFAARLIEAAERNPNAFGLSHNADGEVENDGDGVVVTRITEVRSVDIVDGPATTRGLFESYRPRRRGRMKLREWFQKIKLLPPARRQIRRLMEAGYMDPDQDMPVPMAEAEGDNPFPDPGMDDMGADPGMGDVESAAPLTADDPAEMDPEEALRAGFSAAWNAVFGDTTLDQKAKIKRAKELIDAYERLTASGEAIPEADMEPAAEPDGDEAPVLEGDHAEPDGDEPETLLEEDGCDMTPAKMKESLNRMKARERSRELLDNAGVKPTAALMEALSALPTDAKRLALIEEVKAPYKARSAPLFEQHGRQRSTEDEREPRSAEEFARRLLMHN